MNRSERKGREKQNEGHPGSMESESKRDLSTAELRVDTDELRNRLKRAGEILATGAIRAILRERMEQASQADGVAREDSEDGERAKKSAKDEV